MNIQIAALALNFLQEKYLNDLKKESFSRSKPSKALLDALKHSTSLNKELQIQIESLNAELASVIQQKEFLKQMIQNLNQQIEHLKCSKQEKNKKLCQLQTQNKTKIEFLTNQNNLLKKQIQLLKIKVLNSLGESAQSKFLIGESLQMIKRQSAAISEIRKNKNHNYEASLCDSITLQQSVKFKKYLNNNYEQGNQKNEQTRPNSKFKLEFYEQQEMQTPKIKYVDEQCDQLANMLTLKQQSKISKDFNEFVEQMSPSCHHNIPSIQSITPKIVEITSQQQIFIDDDYQRVETPTLPKCLFNQRSDKFISNESKFKVFQDDLKTSVQGSYKPYVKSSDITFQNLETKKSIQERMDRSSQNKIVSNKHNTNQMIEQRDQNMLDCLQVDRQNNAMIQNISGVDLQGLMNDIEIHPFQDYCADDNKANVNENQNPSNSIQNDDSSDAEDMFYKTQDFSHRKGNKKNNYQSKSKRSASELYQNDKIRTIIDQLNQPSQSSKILSIENQLPSISSHTLSQQNRSNIYQRQQQPRYQKNEKVKVAVHPPNKYMSIAQSFKTIEFNKSYKQLKQNQNKSRNNIDKINEIDKSNESSYLGRSRGQQNNSKSSGSKSMVNSKMILYNNVRRNKKNKSLSPLSVQNRKIEESCRQSIRISNGSEKNDKSYSLIQSIRSKKLEHSVMNSQSLIVPDCSNNNQDCQFIMPNATVILNCSTFRKKFDDAEMTQNAHPPMVTFIDCDDQNLQKYC